MDILTKNDLQNEIQQMLQEAGVEPLKDKVITLRIDNNSLNHLQEIAEAYEISKSEAIRQAIDLLYIRCQKRKR